MSVTGESRRRRTARTQTKRTMKCINLLQPWATLHVIGAKRIETRSRNSNIRGECAIASSAGLPSHVREFVRASPCFAREFLKVLDAELCSKVFDGDLFDVVWNEIERLPRGVIVGTVNYVDCKPTRAIRDDITKREKLFGNYDDGRFGWLSQDNRQLRTPILWKGARGWKNVPSDIEAQIRAQLAS